MGRRQTWLVTGIRWVGRLAIVAALCVLSATPAAAVRQPEELSGAFEDVDERTDEVQDDPDLSTTGSNGPGSAGGGPVSSSGKSGESDLASVLPPLWIADPVRPPHAFVATHGQKEFPTGACTEDAVVDEVTRDLLASPASIGGLDVAKHLKLHYVGAVPTLSGNTLVVQFIQKIPGEELTVPGTFVSESVTCVAATSKRVRMIGHVRLFPELALPPSTPLSDTAILQRAREAVGVASDAPPAFTHRVVRYIEPKAQWLRVDEIGFSPEAFRKAGTDRHTAIVHVDAAPADTDQVWRRDDTLYSQHIEGDVKGGGKVAGPVFASTPLDIFTLSDLTVKAKQGSSTFTTSSDATGHFSFPSLTTPTQLEAKLQGKWAAVSSFAGASDNLVFSGTANPGVPVQILFNPPGPLALEQYTSQVNGYYHTTLIHNWLIPRLPTPVPAIDIPLPVIVNSVQFTCNAGYNLFTPQLVFMKSAGKCPNSAYDTIVYHEYGHFFDDMIGGITDYGLSEGWGDILAMFAAGTPCVGENFFGPSTGCLRTGDNTYPWPPSGTDEQHALGQAWMGFAWKLRQALIASQGASAGIQIAENLIIPVAFMNSASIPAAVLDVLLLDDTDGDLSNGTPHLTEIISSASAHGIPLGSGNAVITSPTPNESLPLQSQPLTITGTAGGPGFGSYQLSYGLGVVPSVWVPITTLVDTPVQNGVLAQWSLSGLAEGAYILRLVVNTVIPQVVFQTFVPVHIDNPNLIQVTTDPFEQTSPAISGSRVVWQDWRAFPPSIYAYDLLTQQEQSLTPALGGAQIDPAIDGDLVVWHEFVSAIPRIFLYNLSTQQVQQITHPSGGNDSQANADISGDRIVYVDFRNGNFDIYLHEITANQQTPLTAHPAAQLWPAIDGDRAVWQDHRNGNADIYAIDLITFAETPVTVKPSEQTNPDVSGTRVVWQDKRNGNWDIYLYDFATGSEQQLTSDPTEQSQPMIDGDLVVWQDFRNGNQDVYAFNVSSGVEFPITVHSGHQRLPAISGTMVAWRDERKTNADIYALNALALATGNQQITSLATDETAPAVGDIRIVWTGAQNGDLNIHAYNRATAVIQQVTNDPFEQRRAAIDGVRVVYEDNRNGNWDIYYTNLVTGKAKALSKNGKTQRDADISGKKAVWVQEDPSNPLSTTIYLLTNVDANKKKLKKKTKKIAANADHPAISGDLVVYDSGAPGNRDILLYNSKKKKTQTISAGPADEADPDISANGIVWQDFRNGNWDIYYYDLAAGKERPITLNSADQEAPAIFGHFIRWVDHRNGNSDIYQYNLNTDAETAVTVDPADQKAPAIFGALGAWEDYRNGNADIYAQ